MNASTRGPPQQAISGDIVIPGRRLTAGIFKKLLDEEHRVDEEFERIEQFIETLGCHDSAVNCTTLYNERHALSLFCLCQLSWASDHHGATLPSTGQNH